MIRRSPSPGRDRRLGAGDGKVPPARVRALSVRVRTQRRRRASQRSTTATMVLPAQLDFPRRTRPLRRARRAARRARRLTTVRGPPAWRIVAPAGLADWLPPPAGAAGVAGAGGRVIAGQASGVPAFQARIVDSACLPCGVNVSPPSAPVARQSHQ